LKGSGKLNPDMTIDYNSLLGDGKVEIPSARIVNLPILNEINKVAKIPALQNLEIKNGWTVLKFKDGKVAVDPTTIKFGNGYDINFKGKNGFDQSIDYDMQLNVPSKELGPATSLAQGMLAKIPGMNAAMPEMVGFVFKVTGSATKPQVKLNKVLAGGSSVKDVAKSAVDDVKNQATNKVDEVKQQAQNAIDQQKKAAEDAARKAKEDAERKAKEAADKIKNDAKNAVKGVFKFPK
jgi:gas vesicle protein